MTRLIAVLLLIAVVATGSVHAANSSTGYDQSSTGTISPYDGDSNPYPQADPNTGTFCDRLLSSNGYDYTNPTHAYALMQIFVSRAYNGAQKNGTLNPPCLNDVQGLTVNTNCVKYFDGTVKYRDSTSSPYHSQPTPTITQDPAAAQALDDKLIRWFGAPAAFACSGGTGDNSFVKTYPYTGSYDQTGVHSGMSITQTQFQAFIDQFLAASLSLGVTNYDFTMNVQPYLLSFGRGAVNKQAICTDMSCACASGKTGANCDQVASSSGGAVVVNPPPSPANLGNDAATMKVTATAALLTVLLSCLLL